MNEKNELKTHFSDYLNYDNKIKELNKQINDIRKNKNEAERNILNIIKIINFNKSKIKYNDEIIIISYNKNSIGLTNKLLLNSLTSFFNRIVNWNTLEVVDIIKGILHEIERNKAILLETKEVTLKLKRL